MANRYNFSDESRKNLPLTSGIETGQIWRNKNSGLKIVIESHGNGSDVWNVFTATHGNRINTQVRSKTLVTDYERLI